MGSYLNIGNTGHHPLPEAEKIVDRVGGKLPHLQRLNRKLSHQLDTLLKITQLKGPFLVNLHSCDGGKVTNGHYKDYAKYV